MSRNYLNPKSFKSERMSFVHADQIANLKKEGYRRGISWIFFSFSFSDTCFCWLCVVGFVLGVAGPSPSFDGQSTSCTITCRHQRKIKYFAANFSGRTWTNMFLNLCSICSFPC